MGTRGPAPTPTSILELRGSWRAKRNVNEPRPTPAAPKCPSDLPPDAKKIWRRLIATLRDMELLTIADWGQLERYCWYWLRWRACEEFIARNGMSYPIKSDSPTYYVAKIDHNSSAALIGFAEYPQVSESHRLDKALKQIEANFGLSPSARTRLSVESPLQLQGIRTRDRGGACGKSRFFRRSLLQ
jgi:P27 family predicted phage terminase small subunit